MLLRAGAAGLWLIPALMFWLIDFRDCSDEVPNAVLLQISVPLLAFAVLSWITWRVMAVRIVGAALGLLFLAFTWMGAPSAPFAVRQLGECDIHGNETLSILFSFIYFPLLVAWVALAVIAGVWSFVRWRIQCAHQRRAQTRYAD